MSLLIMLVAMPVLNQQNSLLNTGVAQEYDNYDEITTANILLKKTSTNVKQAHLKDFL